MRSIIALFTAAVVLAASACKPKEAPEPQAPAQATAGHAKRKPAPKPARPAPDTPVGQRPALRFDMTQDGQPQTADKFEAWMGEQGLRVAKGASSDGDAGRRSEPAPGTDASAAKRPTSGSSGSVER